MKIVGIMSSPSKNGNTAVLVREALHGAAEAGAETTEIWLADYRIEYCCGCMKCLSEGKCFINDDFENIKTILYQSEGIIFGSPTYGLRPNARMLNFLDRIGIFTAYTSSFGGKYLAGIATAGGIGAKGVAKQLTQLANGIFKRGYISGIMGLLVGYDRVEKIPDSLEKARSIGLKMAEDIRTGRKYCFQNMGNRFFNKLFLQRIMTKNIYKNKDTYMKGVYRNLVERKII